MNQQQQSQISLQAHFNTTPSDDDFLEQTFSSCPWPDLSAGVPNHNNSSPLPWDLPASVRQQQQQQIAPSNGTSPPSSAPAMSLLLQQQLLLSRGLTGGLSGAGDSGLLPAAMSLGNGDCFDRSRSDVLDNSSFDSPNPGQDASVQALLNGFTESLYGSDQISNIAQQFHHHQRGAMETQSFGTPAAVTNQSPASGSAGGTPAATRQRVRARRGQATDPHSIAERLRRERIAERMKGLQELVPNANKTDKASMLDEIIDYVNFLRLQVKVLSMSRLGGAAAVSPLVADISSSEGGGECIQASGGVGGKGNNGTQTSPSTNNSIKVTEHQVAKLMEEDMGSAMQYLQSKGLCLMPISLATAISTTTTGNHHHRHQSHGGGGGPSSPNLSVLTGQSATVCNGVPQTSAKDSNSVSKP